MVDTIRAELKPLERVPQKETLRYWREFLRCGETENVLWESCKQKSSPKKKKINTNFYCGEKGVTKWAGEDCFASRNKIIVDIYV